MSGEVFTYTQSTLIHHLTLGSYLFFLNTLAWVVDKYISTGLIVQIIIGLVYGPPLGNILPHPWLEAFQALGDLGLQLLVFHGGLRTRLDLLKANFVLSNVVALIGVLHPIAFSIISFMFIFGWDAVQGFTAGAALSTTSLGTTIAILASLSSRRDLRETRIGTVLLSAAMIDDVSGLIFASIVAQLSEQRISGGELGLAWMILRPIVASTAVAVLTPILVWAVVAPAYRKFMENIKPSFLRGSTFFALVALLSAMLTISYYAGASMLLGAYVAGCSVHYIDLKTERVCEKQLAELSEPKHSVLPGVKQHIFEDVFLRYIEPSNRFIFIPLFFASVGAAIPFTPLFKPSVIWKGMLFSFLMFIGKFLTGLAILLWPTRWPPPSPPDDGKTAEAAQNVEKTFKQEETVDTAASTPPRVSSQELSQELPTHRTMSPSASSHKLGLPIYPALLIAFAMVSRGEISLLIAHIGRTILGEDAFLVVVWAVIVCTLIGPISTGLLVQYRSDRLIEGPWG